MLPDKQGLAEPRSTVKVNKHSLKKAWSCGCVFADHLIMVRIEEETCLLIGDTVVGRGVLR